MDDHLNDILTINEAANRQKIPRSSVDKLAQQGKIPAQKVGRHGGVYRPRIVNWIAWEVPDNDKGNVKTDG